MRCYDCPRACGVDRPIAQGYCHAGEQARIARSMAHHWEEPCISGTQGSGAIFFSGCNLGCVFCQNYALSDGTAGKNYTSTELAGLMLALQAEDVHNINLVTATPHLGTLLPALKKARTSGLTVPVVYNSSGYETVDSLKKLDGLVDIYLPDLKYVSSALSGRFSKAQDYFIFAMPAILEMYRQVGTLCFDGEGIAKSGILIRHLVLPGCVHDSRAVLDAIKEVLPLDTWLSIMRQYTPTPRTTEPPLNRPLTKREYERTISYALSLGFHNIWIQQKSSVNSAFTPSFTFD